MNKNRITMVDDEIEIADQNKDSDIKEAVEYDHQDD